MLRTIKKWAMMPFAAKHVWMPGRTYRGPIVLTAAEEQTAINLQQHLHRLAVEIGERHDGAIDALNLAADHIALHLGRHGVLQRQEFPLGGQICANIIAELPGSSDAVFVIGAHYDTIPGSPGANDNGSGVAALLELHRLLAGKALPVRFRFVAFANEEHVGLPASSMGSHLYAASCRSKGELIIGMWSLETLGYYSDEPNSQRYPAPLDLFYPTEGNFVAFVGHHAGAKFVRQCVRAFRREKGFPCEGAAPPASVADTARSDHWGFWQAGYDALMVTDTANFRYPHYHTSNDTTEHIDARKLARVTTILSKAALSVAADRK